MKKNAVEKAVRETAASALAVKYRLPQYKKEGTPHNEEYKKALQHKKVCEEVAAFADAHKGIPFYFIMSVGVGKGAYKTAEFEKGYKGFDAEKVEAVAKMGDAYYAYNAQYGKKMSDVAIRLMTRYYEKVSKKYNEFLVSLNNSLFVGSMCGSREADYKFLCSNIGIFGKDGKDAA